ncbi:hypothetical protein [Chryseobacterium sp.]|uniref:hypothetical protein n=1 Tax=Chryseobacterium sp. TaxID=1871047 RepID=UPI0028978C6D|nr:hypothetical protein [Chryseobacterium sp.]
MQKNLYLIIISFFLVSCYTYQVKKQPDPAAAETKAGSKKTATANNDIALQAKSITAAPQNLSSPQPPGPMSIQEKLTPNKNVRIEVDGKTYKVIVDRWESDSLVAHPIRSPKKILKFHKDQINSEKIAEKRFSQPIADIITVAVYTGIGVLVWSLLK